MVAASATDRSGADWHGRFGIRVRVLCFFKGGICGGRGLFVHFCEIWGFCLGRFSSEGCGNVCVHVYLSVCESVRCVSLCEFVC